MEQENDMAHLEPDGRDLEMLGTPAQLAALFAALSEATGGFTKIVKNREVKIESDKRSYKFMYAELGESIDATRPALKAAGLAVMQPYTLLRGVGLMRTILTHKDGGALIAACEVPEADSIKSLGGNITYMRRYAYNALLCLAADQDLDDMPEAKRGETSAQSEPRPKASGSASTGPVGSASRNESPKAPPASPSSSGSGASPASSDEGPRRLNQTEKAELTKLVREIHGLDPADLEGVKSAVNGEILGYVQKANRPNGHTINVNDYKPLHALLFARAVKAKQDRTAEGSQS